ncbi:MAG: hypothetical protein GY715_14290, partial [Planctomycetes bacterium]|nr:hypothetical protein [Planctomycetota bacterium]
MSRAGLLVASILAFVLCGTSSAAPANRVITQPLDVQADELIIGTDVLGNITIRFNRIGTEKFIRWIEGTGLQLDYGNGSELTFIDGALITDRNSDPSAFVLSRANTLRASFRLSDTTAEDWFIGDGVAGTRWIYGDATQGNVRISTETDEQLPAAKLDVRGSDTTLPTLLIRCADSQSDNCIEVRNSDNSNRTVFDKFGLLASAELDGSGGTCTSPDRSACWKEPMILRSYNSEDPAEFESPTEPAFVLQQMNTGIEATGNLVEYRVNVSPTTAEGESGTLSAYMTQGGSQYRDVGGTAYLVADELSDPNWIGTHEFQSPGAVQFEI